MPPPIRIVAFLMLTLLSTAPANAAPPDAVDFARDVRPLLSKHCLQCHGPDAQARKGDLRLDDREQAILELPTGNRAIVPEHPADSELIDRVTSDDDSRLMPPPKFAGRLTSAEVETLRRWIAQGAHYSKHWAYVKPVRVMPPAVTNPAWPTNEIDQFILKRLDEEGITPSPVADRETLLRRVTLDLTGLPPTLEELRRFNADTSPDAYERVVDGLLGKAAYGERWGAVWLDLARYGDSQGYIHDPPRTIWRWRDWLITALNNNLPYDQFTLEMLAGDLLPGATTDQRIA
ncbi:MAG: DUF1549 domain-containing protein, partial [Planctomycetota bacterium]|nr:DUF1549 domain-containing protein [Planctomycetota bacterium]